MSIKHIRQYRILFWLLASLWIAAPAFGAPPTATIIFEHNTGLVVHSANADKPRYPASLTKMMTLYMVFSAIESGHLSWSDRLHVSRHAASQPASKLTLRPGGYISVRDAVSALATKSANDVAVVVAERLGHGFESHFAYKMTRRARSLGMMKTRFMNASGLHHPNQISTARDMAILARRLRVDFPQHYAVFSRRQFRWNGRVYKSHNNMLKVSGTDGIKTGYLRRSGYHVAVSSKRRGYRLGAVIMGGRTAAERDQKATRLLNRYFALKPNDRAKAIDRHGVLEPPSRFGSGFDIAYLHPPPMDQGGPGRVRKPHTIAISTTSRPDDPLAKGGLALVKNVDILKLPSTVASKAKRIKIVARPDDIARRGAVNHWSVQVGVFWRKRQAYSMAKSSVSNLPQALAEGIDIQVVRRQGRRRALWRARLSGFDRRDATNACRALRQSGVDCFTVAPL